MTARSIPGIDITAKKGPGTSNSDARHQMRQETDNKVRESRSTADGFTLSNLSYGTTEFEATLLDPNGNVITPVSGTERGTRISVELP